MIIKHKNITIELTNETDLASMEFSNKFKKQYPVDLGFKSEYQASTKYGIRITENGIVICSALLSEYAGATIISDKSFLIKNDLIYICCSNQIYSINLEDLSINWRNEYDFATCFGIYEFNEDFIIHGELKISRINQKGETQWDFRGSDIFVNLEGKTELKIIENRIELIDFENYRYKLNAQGKLLTKEKLM